MESRNKCDIVYIICYMYIFYICTLYIELKSALNAISNDSSCACFSHFDVVFSNDTRRDSMISFNDKILYITKYTNHTSMNIISMMYTQT